jgi:hypothetical protein
MKAHLRSGPPAPLAGIVTVNGRIVVTPDAAGVTVTAGVASGAIG